MKRLLVLLTALSACQPASDVSTTEAPSGDASVPALAVLQTGETITSSVVLDGDTKRLVVTHADGSTVEVASGDVSDHSQAAPRLAVAPDGTVLVLYVVNIPVEGRRFPASDVMLARSDDGGRSFGAPARVNPEARTPTGHTFADLAVGARRRGLRVVARRHGVGRVEGTSRAPRRSHARFPSARSTTARTSRITARWATAERNGDPGTTLVVARSVDGGRTFAAPVAVARGTCPCCRTALDVGPSGSVRVVWRHIWDGGERDPAVATSTDGGRTFGAPVRVHADRWAIDGCPHAGPSVAEDADGLVHVAWFTGAEARMGLWHAGLSDDAGASFAAPTALGRGAPLGQTRAVRDATGRVWLAWEDRATRRDAHHVAAGGDTTTVAGVDPALVGTQTGWALATVDGRRGPAADKLTTARLGGAPRRALSFALPTQDLPCSAVNADARLGALCADTARRAPYGTFGGSISTCDHMKRLALLGLLSDRRGGMRVSARAPRPRGRPDGRRRGRCWTRTAPRCPSRRRSAARRPS